MQNSVTQIAERYARDFMNQLQLRDEIKQQCDWSCVIWSKDHWANEARKAKVNLHQTKEQWNSTNDSKILEGQFTSSQFLNTVAQIYSRLFDDTERSCSEKSFDKCPFFERRDSLLRQGSLASTFVTILQKATFYSMLDEHPLDSGLLDEEYRNVYGIDLTDFADLESSLRDGRFAKLFDATVRRAGQLAGLPQKTLTRPLDHWTS